MKVTGKSESVINQLSMAITEELEAEDRLNAEVRKMLTQFEREFAEGRADYPKNVYHGEAKID